MRSGDRVEGVERRERETEAVGGAEKIGGKESGEERREGGREGRRR